MLALKLLQFNLQDLFLKLAYPIDKAAVKELTDHEWAHLAPSDHPIKPLTQLRGIARVIASEQPDIVLACEVGGKEALANLSRLFLDDRYEALATPRVSDRGIDTGFLVRRDLGWTTQLISHAKEPVPFKYPHEIDPVAFEVSALLAPTLNLGDPNRRRLSRDIPELRLFASGATAPTLVILLAHLKSGFDPDRIDPGGAVRRAAEVLAMLRIRDGILAELGPDAPLVIAGDFNGQAARSDTAAEFAPLYATTDLEDALEIAGRDPLDRLTHVTYYLATGRATQLDYIFVSQSLRDKVMPQGTYVHRYRFEDGTGELQMPRSIRDRARLPSDHFPVACTLDLKLKNPRRFGLGLLRRLWRQT